MSKNNSNQQRFVANNIKRILSNSMLLDQNREALVQYTTQISRRTLGIDGCNQFKIVETGDVPIDYGIFDKISTVGFNYDGLQYGDNYALLIPEFSWAVHIPGFGLKQFTKQHIEGWTIDDYDDFFCCISLSYDKTTNEFIHKIDFNSSYIISPIQ